MVNNGDNKRCEEEVSAGARNIPTAVPSLKPAMVTNLPSENSRNEKSDFDVSLALLELGNNILERKNVKKVHNVGIPVSADNGSTTSNLFCTFINEVQKRTMDENILHPTDNLRTGVQVGNQNCTDSFDFESTERTEAGKYSVQFYTNNKILYAIIIISVLTIPIL